jgi:general secretion pathway protein K
MTTGSSSVAGCEPDQRGFVLLIVLWTLGLLALFGTELLVLARQDTQRARNLLDAAALEAAANGAVQQAVFANLDLSNRHWPADGRTRVIAVAGVPVAVRIEDDAGKVNPNVAAPQLLQALLVAVGADKTRASDIAAAIVDWRMASGSPARLTAIDARYAAAHRAYAPSGAPFTSLEELGAVLGMTPELLARLRPHLTLYTDADPDMSTRDAVVARALAAMGEGQAGGDEDVTGLLSITADAHGEGRTHFAVRAVVRTNARPEGRRYEILAHAQSWGDPL